MRRLFLPLLFVVCLVVALPVWAQTPEPAPTPTPQGMIPYSHIVQEGENLTIIATSYGITVDELLSSNGLTDADVLSVGQALIIPGRTGEEIGTTYIVEAGDTLEQIAAIYNSTPDAISAANRLIHPDYELVPGQTIAINSRTGSVYPQNVTGLPHVVKYGESLPMIAAQYNLTSAQIALANNLDYPYYLLPGQRLRIPAQAPYRYLPGEWVDIQVRPFSIQQGSTVSIYVENLLDGIPSGQFGGQNLHFFPVGDGFAALVGIDAFTEPGSYELELTGSGSQPWRPFRQSFPVQSSGFVTQYISLPDDPVARAEEDALFDTFYTQFSSEPMWSGLFQAPVTTTVVTGPYGDARSYDGGPVEIYHSGVDFAGGVGTPIMAPAPGTVLYAQPELTLHGGTVIVDHGVGVMSAYFHLSEIFVQPGDNVTVGQPIGAGGSTGLSTGPHLHWEMRVNNVPVNGLQWLEMTFP